MPRLPPLNALRAFEAVARHMSFQKAAGELAVTPAAVSYQVRQLEDHLGLELFVRMNRAIALTDAGEVYYPALADGFARLSQAQRTLERFKEGDALVISVGPAFTAKWLAPRLWRFLEANPTIDARIAANLRLSDFAADGIDAAIRFGSGHYEGVHWESLIGDALIPLCSPDYRDRMAISAPGDLARCTLVHDTSLEALRDSARFADGRPANWAGWLEREGVQGADASHGPRFNHADHGIDAAVEGAGVVLGRLVLAAADLRSGRLVAPLGGALPIDLGFFFVCPQPALRRPAVSAFRDWLLEEVQCYQREIMACQASPRRSVGKTFDC